MFIDDISFCKECATNYYPIFSVAYESRNSTTAPIDYYFDSTAGVIKKCRSTFVKSVTFANYCT